jgi:hypothetical protein
MIRNQGDLMERLSETAGHSEEILDCGWGTVGARNVLVGVTGTRLLLEYTTIGMKTKSVDEIPFSMIEAIESRKGDSTIPGWARINVQNAILDALTTSLVVKKTGERSIHVSFRPLPGFRGNREAGLRIARVIIELRPDIADTVDLQSERKAEGSTAGRSFRVALLTGILLAVPFAFIGGVPGAVAGFFAGAVTGGVFALFWPYLRRTVTGRG